MKWQKNSVFHSDRTHTKVKQVLKVKSKVVNITATFVLIADLFFFESHKMESILRQAHFTLAKRAKKLLLKTINNNPRKLNLLISKEIKALLALLNKHFQSTEQRELTPSIIHFFLLDIRQYFLLQWIKFKPSTCDYLNELFNGDGPITEVHF